MTLTGYLGAAAIASALTALGEPVGMIGGIGTLIILALISRGLTKYGFNAIFEKVVVKLKQRVHTKAEAINKINRYRFI